MNNHKLKTMTLNFTKLKFTVGWIFTLFAVVIIFPIISFAQPSKGYIVATDYLKADGKTDITNALQRLIDTNPNRTLFFPDGIYNISHSILTPADPKMSVSFILSNYACLKAIGDWKCGGAVIRLGASHPTKDITEAGSNYQFTGGIVDGADKADGISIDGGRETRISDVSIKHTRIGIHIKYGANNGSSDADIMNVNIVGDNHKDAIGVLVEGFDNTLTNMRIAAVNTGVWLKSGGNSLRNVHPLFIFGDSQDYLSSCGFHIERSDNFLYYCYGDQMATAFQIDKGVSATITDCFCFWYTDKGEVQTAISCDGPFESLVFGLKAIFHRDAKKITLLKAEVGGKGHLVFPFIGNRNLSKSDVSSYYIFYH